MLFKQTYVKIEAISSYSVIVRVRVKLSQTTILFRTTLARTITLYELPILLGSNHLLCSNQLKGNILIGTTSFVHST